MSEIRSTLPLSEHFELTALAGGVYAAIATPMGGGYSNAGIIDLGDRTLVFDAFETPQAAVDLRAAAEQLTGCPPSHVIISHAHGDHWGGAQAFAGSVLLTPHESRALMPEASSYLQQFQQDPSEIEGAIQYHREQITGEADEHRRRILERSIARLRHLEQALPTLELCLPQLTFDGTIMFHGSRRSAELRATGSGHTAGDCLLVLPGEGIVFMGDLAFFQQLPYMGSCEPPAWIAQLEQWEHAQVETFVPGHGPLGSRADVTLEKECLVALQQLVVAVIEAGGSVDDALQQPLPAPFDDWARGTARFEANVRFLYDHMRGA